MNQSMNAEISRLVDAISAADAVMIGAGSGLSAAAGFTYSGERFQLADFPKERLFYTQGDYGLWQCSVPCHDSTYDNFEAVARMVEEQHGMRVPSELVPYCPRCGEPMSMNLRSDATFVEDAGWHRAARRYQDFIEAHGGSRIIFLELGVGANTPGIIKYPFWKQTYANTSATYACVNFGQAQAPAEIRDRSILINGDIHEALTLALHARQG